MLAPRGDCHPADFRDGYNLDDCSVHKADGCSQVGSRNWAVYSHADGTPNCRRILAGWHTLLVADDTKRAADDRDSTTRPNRHGCNRRGAPPSSIPTRPTPM